MSPNQASKPYGADHYLFLLRLGGVVFLEQQKAGRLECCHAWNATTKEREPSSLEEEFNLS